MNRQPAGSACRTAATVRVRASASPSNDALVGVFPCEVGAGQVDDLPEGNYFLTFLLDDPTGLGFAAVVSGVPVTVVADSVETLPQIDFDLETGPQFGEAIVSWTVNSGQNCPSGGAGRVAVSISADDGRDPAEAAGPCDAYSILLSALRPGVYTVGVTLTDPGRPGLKATARLENITVLAGVRADLGPIDLTCPFCPGG